MQHKLSPFVKGLFVLSASVAVTACSGTPNMMPLTGSTGSTSASSTTSDTTASTTATTTAASAVTSLSGQSVKAQPFTPSAWTVEYPQGAGKFVDSVGIDIHLGENNTPYVNNFSTMVQQLHALGVHHVRDGIHRNQQNMCEQGKTLAAAGVTVSYVTDTDESSDDIKNWASCVGTAMDSLEGPNEYDLAHNPNDTHWPQTLAAYQTMVWNTVKQTPALAATPVYGPSLTSGGAYSSVGDLSSVEDFGNMHDYLAGRNPGTGGWGNGGYGSIAYNIRVAKPASVSKPIASTETGFRIGGSNANGFDTEISAAKYMPRLYMESFNNHVPRTYTYEMYDEGTAPFESYGWVRSDASVAPRYTYWAMKNLLAVLQDSNLNYNNGGPLYYTMTGQTYNVHHTLLQKSDGTIFLAMWIEYPDHDPNSGAAIKIAPQTVQINMPAAPRQASLYSYDSRMNLNAAGMQPSTAINVSLTDTVTLLRMHW